MNLKVKAISNQQIDIDVCLLEINAPELAAKAKAGQFVMIKPFNALDPLLARPFSIHGVDGDAVFVLYKVVGRGTEILSRIKAGDELMVWGPLGKGYDLNLKKPFLVAGGMGIASLAFAASTLVSNGIDPKAILGVGSVKDLVYGVFDDEKRYLLGGVSWLVFTEDGTYGQKGLVTEGLNEKLEDCDGLLACGPLPMLKALAPICEQNNVPYQASLEAPMACGLGACLGCAIPQKKGGYLRACKEGPVVDATSVDWQKV